MSVRINRDGPSADAVIELFGRCGVEDAETLQRHLLDQPSSPVEWGACEQLHSAVLQVLLAANSITKGLPANPFLRDHIHPLLRPRAEG